MSKLPGGPIAKRPLHFIYIVDTSGSMKDYGKIQTLNNAIKETIPHMQKIAEDNTSAEVLVRVLRFSTGAQWITNSPVPISKFKWVDLVAEGERHMGAAFSMVADALKIPPMTNVGLPPVLVLVTDGMPTDDYRIGLKKLFDQPWGKEAVKIAIPSSDNVDMNILQQFIGNNEIKPLNLSTADRWLEYIRWSPTVVLKNVSSPSSKVVNLNEQENTATTTPSNSLMYEEPSTDIETW